LAKSKLRFDSSKWFKAAGAPSLAIVPIVSDMFSLPSKPMHMLISLFKALASSAAPTTTTATKAPPRKNWDGITETILSSEKDKSLEEDPNVGGDSTLNSFFQKIFKDADEDTKRAMMKSYSESGGTTLSTNWDEVKKGRVEVKPPEGQEWKKWDTSTE
jgi:hypothetical protein